MSLKPLKLAQLLAVLYLLLSLGGLTALLLNIFERPDIQTQLSMLLVLLIASSSLILFCLYILGAYLGRAYLEVKGRPSYIVYKDLVVREPTDIAREPSSSSDRGAEADP